MKVNQLKLGTLISYLQMGLGIIVSLLYTPAMIRLLGDSEYGLYNTVSAAISMLSILSLGFNSGYIRYYAKYKKASDQEAIDRLNGMFLTIFTLIGAVALACGLFLTFNLELVFDTGLTAAEYRIARKLMLLLTVNLALSFPMSVFANIISANERFVFLKLLGIVKTLGGPLVTLPLLLMGFRSVAMVTVTVVLNLAIDLCYLYYVFAVLKNRFLFGKLDRKLAGGLFAYTSFIAINLLVDQVNTHLDKFLLGRITGTTAVAVYSVGYTLYHYYMMFSTAVSGVFTPRIHKIVQSTAEDPVLQKRKLTELFTRVGRLQFLLLALVASGLVFFGKWFITDIWAGAAYADAYYVTLLLVLPATVPLIQNLGIEIQRAQNRHQFRSIAYLVMAVINLVISVILCHRYGALGAPIGTAISLILANGIVMNIYYHKRCNLDIVSFWKEIFRLSLGLILPVAVGVAICLWGSGYGVWMQLLMMALYTVVYCVSMWLFGMNGYEKNILLRILAAVRKKGSK
jgi:O-antigen/teichoic acid export membrane protein